MENISSYAQFDHATQKAPPEGTHVKMERQKDGSWDMEFLTLEETFKLYNKGHDNCHPITAILGNPEKFFPATAN